MTTTTSTDVLVAGAGPTGLVLACELRRRGISCRVIDRAPAYPTSTRGHGLQPRSLEVFDLMGIAPQILATGTTSLVTNFYAGGKLIFELDSHIEPRPDAPYLSQLVTRQPRIETVLRDHLHDLGGTVELGHALSALRQDDDGVTATISDPAGREIERVRCSYLAGCDGGHSTARGVLGLTFEGQTAAEHFVLFDAELDWDLDPSPDRVHWFLHDQGMLMAGTFGGAPTWNVMAQLLPSTNGQVEPATPGLLARLVTERTGRAATRITNTTWMSNYTINRRMANHYRRGRVFLAGDAVHVHSPAGGQGMNTGIQDAFNLGWKLALTIHGQAADTLLDTYEEERAPIARAVLAKTGSGDRALYSHNPVASFVRDHVAAPALQRPAIREALFSRLAQLDVNYRQSSLSATHHPHLGPPPPNGHRDIPRLDDWLTFHSGPQAGDRAPQAHVVNAATGAPTSLFGEYRAGSFTLLLFTGQYRVGHGPLADLAEGVTARVGDLVAARLVIDGRADVTPGTWPVPALLDTNGTAHHTYHARRAAAYLIRPDGYVAYRSQSTDPAPLFGHLDTLLATNAIAARRSETSVVTTTASVTRARPDPLATSGDDTAAAHPGRTDVSR